MPLTGVPFAGETIEVTIRASRTATGQVVRSADSAEAWFWAPGREPGDGEPDHRLPAVWDDRARGFTARADTTGWVPGTWSYQGRITAQEDTGPVVGWSEFTELPLR